MADSIRIFVLMYVADRYENNVAFAFISECVSTEHLRLVHVCAKVCKLHSLKLTEWAHVTSTTKREVDVFIDV